MTRRRASPPAPPLLGQRAFHPGCAGMARWRRTPLGALLLALYACDPTPRPTRADTPEPAVTSRPSPPSSTDTTIPAPSADTVLQVAFPAEHRVERFLTDGRWVRVADDGTLVEQRPRSFYERGRATLSPDGLRRLAEALDAVDFFALPAEVPANLPATPTPVRLPNGQGPLAPRPIVITAPTPDGGGFHTVRGTGDPRLPETYGALAPLVRVLDREAWGGWMYE